MIGRFYRPFNRRIKTLMRTRVRTLHFVFISIGRAHFLVGTRWCRIAVNSNNRYGHHISVRISSPCWLAGLLDGVCV